MSKGQQPNRRGTPPPRVERVAPYSQADPMGQGGYPLLSLRYLQPRFGTQALSSDQCRSFLEKWAKRSMFTWLELSRQGRHGLGYEMLPHSQIHPRPPEFLRRDEYMIFRHEGNHPFAGIKIGDVFFVLWIEARYGDLYAHG